MALRSCSGWWGLGGDNKNTWSQPAMAASRVSGCSKSPRAVSTPRRWIEAAPSGERTKARTGAPASASSRTSSPPVVPVAPVTKITGSSIACGDPLGIHPHPYRGRQYLLGNPATSPAAPHPSQVPQRNAAQPPTRHRSARPNDAAFQQQLLPVAEHHWPNPAAYRAHRASQAGWSAAPTEPGPTDHVAKPSAWSSRSAAVTGPLAQRRQRPRRRITPNTNTTTTTMISTHNHVDMAASLVGAGAVHATLLPAPEQATRSPPGELPGPIDGRARAGSRDPCTRDLPADLGWPGGGPDRSQWR